jgi:hypothetical protein
MEGKLNGNDLRLISMQCLEDRMKLIGMFKIAAGDVITIRGRLWSTRTTGIKWEFMRFGVDCNQKGKLSGLLEELQWPFILANKLLYHSHRRLHTGCR